MRFASEHNRVGQPIVVLQLVHELRQEEQHHGVRITDAEKWLPKLATEDQVHAAQCSLPRPSREPAHKFLP